MSDSSTGGLGIWTIYNHPTDYPNHYVVRAFLVGTGGPVSAGDAVLADTLQEARALVPGNLWCLPRQRDDDPHIVESWL